MERKAEISDRVSLRLMEDKETLDIVRSVNPDDQRHPALQLATAPMKGHYGDNFNYCHLKVTLPTPKCLRPDQKPCYQGIVLECRFCRRYQAGQSDAPCRLGTPVPASNLDDEFFG